MQEREIQRGYLFHKPRINTPKPSLPLVFDDEINLKQNQQESSPIKLPQKRDSFLINRILDENNDMDANGVNNDNVDIPDELFLTQLNTVKNFVNVKDNDETASKKDITEILPQIIPHVLPNDNEAIQSKTKKPIRLISSAPKSKSIKFVP